jgi:hypothetical protein
MGDTSMGALQKLEDQLAGLFKDLPALPKGAKDALVQYWPYLALLLGILQLLAAWSLWNVANYASKWLDYASSVTGTSVGYSETDKLIIYGGVVLLTVNAVIFFMAYGPLLKKAKKGWDLLFLTTIINVVYGFVQIFMTSRGIGSFIGSLVGSAIGLYLLFQIRDRYTRKKA